MLAGMTCDRPEPKLLATVRDYDELIAAIRTRRDELQVTHETIGIPSGYASKLLTDPPIKRMGMISLGPMLGALGLMLVVVEDPAALSRVRGRLVNRRYPPHQRASAPALRHAQWRLDVSLRTSRRCGTKPAGET
jgi:hypothetical protein